MHAVYQLRFWPAVEEFDHACTACGEFNGRAIEIGTPDGRDKEVDAEGSTGEWCHAFELRLQDIERPPARAS
jgi:hypothetical protein